MSGITFGSCPTLISYFYHANILFYTPTRAELWATNDIKEVARQYAKDKDRKMLRDSLKDLQSSLRESIQKMNEGLIANWNSRIQPDDDVYHLGDFMMGQNIHWEKILTRLNGRIHLINGNHDARFVEKNYVQKRMIWIKSDYELKVQDPDGEGGKVQRICLHHFPKFVWDKGHRGAWHLHGHCHGSIDHVNKSTRIDIGVDSEHSNYFPLNYAEVKKIMSTRTYTPIDHHNDPSSQ